MGPVLETFDSPPSRKRRFIRNLAMILACILAVGILAWKLCFAPKLSAAPALTKQWHEQMYGLDEGEVMRFVIPPSARLSGYGGVRLHWVVQGPPIAPFYYSQNDRHSFWFVWLITKLRSIDLDIPETPACLPFAGDWVVRPHAPDAKKLQAMVFLMSRISGRNLVLEKELVERDVLIAQGEWSYKPLPTTTRPLEVQLTVGAGANSLSVGDFAEFIERVESMADLRVVDEIRGTRPKKVAWSWKGSVVRVDDSADLDRFIANLEKQTSLKFVKARRPIWMWFIREPGASTQPTSRP